MYDTWITTREKKNNLYLPYFYTCNLIYDKESRVNNLMVYWVQKVYRKRANS